LNNDAIGAKCSRVLSPAGIQQKPNTWKAMTTTHAKAECVPGIWKKWWNAFVNCFKRDAACACSAESQPARKVEDAKAQEKKGAK
jgi:hypothetical protein